jgi:dienelactone hydrolase
MRTVIFILLSLHGNSQVMDWNASVSLHDHLLQKAHRQYDTRRDVFDKVKVSKEKTVAYSKSAREKLIRLLGDMPIAGALNANTTGVLRQEGYSIEKIVYESFPHHHVTANLYMPSRKGVYPAVIFLCGHEDAAKITSSYQQTAMLLVQHGFVVLVIDPFGQGERLQVTTAAESMQERPGKKEHTLMNASSNLVGTSSAAYEVWDNKRGVDYLLTRPEVDAERIGCIGNSGGGMQAIYFSAYDKRVKAIAVCSYLSSRERMYDTEGPTDGCVELPNEGRELMEMSDYLVAAAPVPLLILAGRFDGIDFIGTMAACNDLQKAYRAMGSPEKFKLFAYDDGHGISRPKREEAVKWFRKWLYKDSADMKEENLVPLPPQQLLVTATGQVETEFTDEISIADRNLGLFDELAPKRKQFLSQPGVVKRIRDLLGLEIATTPVRVEQAILRREGQMPLPVQIVRPTGKPDKIMLWLHEGGKSQVEDSLLQLHRTQGYLTLVCDISGTGELEDKPAMNEARYYNKEYRNAMIALHNGSSMVAQRVSDIINILDFISTDSEMPVTVHATGLLTLPALHAMVLDNRIQQLYLHNALRSFKDILQKPIFRNWYSYVIPGVLKYYDIPDLVKLAPPESIHFLDN